MEIRWGKNKMVLPTTGLSSQVREDAAETIVHERRHASLLDQIITEHEINGGFQNLEGKGKPLNLEGEVTENYYLHRVMKNANVLPYWLELQHEIRDMLKSLTKRVAQSPDIQVENELLAINTKIRMYNKVCPTPLLEKPLVNPENYSAQIPKWE